MGIKQFHLVCTFIIWCLFSFLIKCFEKSLGAVVILSLVWNGDFIFLMFSSLKQVILVQTRQNGYQTVPFGVYIHNIIWCLFSFLIKCFEKSLGAVVILSLVWNGDLFLTFSRLKQVNLVQTRQNGYQTVPFGVYIHNLMFVFISDKVFWKEPRCGSDFITCMERWLTPNVFKTETSKSGPN